MSQVIQVFPRAFAAGDNPQVVAILYTDEEELAGATVTADLFRLEVEAPIETDLVEATATEDEPGRLRLVCRLQPLVTEGLTAGVYFLRFRVVLASGSVLTIPPDDFLRLRCTG